MHGRQHMQTATAEITKLYWVTRDKKYDKTVSGDNRSVHPWRKRSYINAVSQIFAPALSHFVIQFSGISRPYGANQLHSKDFLAHFEVTNLRVNQSEVPQLCHLITKQIPILIVTVVRTLIATLIKSCHNQKLSSVSHKPKPEILSQQRLASNAHPTVNNDQKLMSAILFDLMVTQ